MLVASRMDWCGEGMQGTVAMYEEREWIQLPPENLEVSASDGVVSFTAKKETVQLC